MDQNNIMIYTDGGCYNNGDRKGDGSYAFVNINTANNEYVDIIGEYMTSTTNNRTEMMAAIQAIKYAYTNDIKKITLVSDSGYMVKGYTDPTYLERWVANGWKTASHKPVQNVDLWSELRRLSWHVIFNFVHIRGHNKDKDSNHAYWNDICDRACTYLMNEFKMTGFIVTLRYYFKDKKFEIQHVNVVERRDNEV